jgi:hypothetical protein
MCPLGAALIIGASENPRFYQDPQQLAGVVLLALLILFLIINGFIAARESGQWIIIALATILLTLLPILFIVRISAPAINYATACNQPFAPNATLQYCDFNNQDLSHTNLSGANLTGTQLSGANLQNADLSGSNLAIAQLSGTNLQSADLSGAVLTRANLSNADLTNAILNKAVLDNTNMLGAIGITDAQLAAAFDTSIDSISAHLSKKNIRLESRESMLKGIKDLCQGTGISGASNYTSSDSFHPVLLWDSLDTDQIYSDFVKPNWEPMAMRFLELVVCPGEPEAISIQTCNYTVVGEASAEPFAIERFQFYQRFRLVATKTGADVIEKSISGSIPRECPETAPVTQSDLFGGPVLFEDVEKWLVEFVNPP